MPSSVSRPKQREGGVARNASGKTAAKAAPSATILRKIPAARAALAASGASALSKQALELAGGIEATLASGKLQELSPEASQALFAALLKHYRANFDFDNLYPIAGGAHPIAGTDAMVACSALLKAVDLQVFELGMWQSWTGR